MFYGRSVWDPKLIISQIITMQILFYFFLVIILGILDTVGGYSLNLEQIFSVDAMNFKSGMGIISILAFLLNSLIM